ncbi:MAG: YebC/PmpR family DNA-binding transcriptional regulator [Candidatus Moranbacteria bacterium]|nr:YebC/PmpR family DNA-binding transcriptional regulator [Candidatus Moranbacteria bacterium]
MSGHSHWAGIRHKKALTDTKKASVFTKMANNITIAARHGGNPDMNFRLRLAIDAARAVNMPKDNIERAVKRGTGELTDGAVIEELVYEAYGPGQVALLIGTATDNRNRTFGDIRTILTKNGGKIVSEGAVSYLFTLSGEIVIPLDNRNQDEAELTAIEAGAEDVSRDGVSLIVLSRPEDLQKTKESLEAAGFAIGSASLAYIPTQKMSISKENRTQYDALLEALDEHADVQDVWDNLSD